MNSRTGMTVVINMKPITSLHVIEHDEGIFGFVGRVPVVIGFIDATPEKIRDGAQFGQRFGPKTRTFKTRQEAIDFAESHGFEVESRSI